MLKARKIYAQFAVLCGCVVLAEASILHSLAFFMNSLSATLVFVFFVIRSHALYLVAAVKLFNNCLCSNTKKFAASRKASYILKSFACNNVQPKHVWDIIYGSEEDQQRLTGSHFQNPTVRVSSPVQNTTLSY